MSFESVYRSKHGAREIEKVANFIGSLVIKNEYEARKAETTDSLANYYTYYGAYTNTDDFSDYSLEDRKNYADLVWTWWSSQKGLGYNVTRSLLETVTKSTYKALQEQYDNKVQSVRDYLKALRIARIYSYDEKNLYYKQFLGKPISDDQIVYVANMDIGEEGYSEVTDLSVLPDSNLYYFTKNSSGEFESIGKLKAWYRIDDEGNPVKIANNFYYLNTIPVHEIDKTIYPLTYNYFILQQHIKEIIEKYPTYYYIRFIDDGNTAFYLRTLQNYAIIKYDNTIFDSTELSYFFKAYDKARKQVVLDYINGFDSKQPLYNLLMIQNLLYFSVINYSNSYIEKYSVGIYTEENCNAILESHGYSKLTGIEDLELKQRIVKNLNELIENKANNYILELILDKILQDPNSELKRYYLEKRYTTDSDASIKIDTTKGLENSVELVLREVPIFSTEELSDTADNYHDYDKFVVDDDTWGGIDKTDSEETKATKKEVLKKKLLATDFNQVLTKYITLTRTVDILESQRELRDLIYIMLKYFDDHESQDFFTKKISFEAYDVTPAALLAASCWLQQMKFYDDPDTIIKDNCVINSSVVFRKMGTMAIDRNKLESETFIVDGKPMVVYDISPEIGSWKVIDFMKENPDDFADYLSRINNEGSRLPTIRLIDKTDSSGNVVEKGILDLGTVSRDGYKHLDNAEADIEDYMSRFRFYQAGRDLGEVTNSTTFEDLVSDYKHQYTNLIKRITLKLRDSYDYREYQAWMYMLEQSRTNNSVEFIFKGHDTFSSFLTEMESEGLINYVYSETDWLSGNRNMAKICEAQTTINKAFKEWVTSNFSSLVYQNDESADSKDTSFVNDMVLLFDEFLSVFSELYSVSYNYTFGDLDYEGLDLQLFYNPINILQTQKLKDRLNLSFVQSSKLHDELDSDELELKHELDFFISRQFNDSINKDINLDAETNEYIPDDPFEYEKTLHFSQSFKENLGLSGKFTRRRLNLKLNDRVGLTGVLTITPSYKEKKTYYETNS